MPLDVTVPQRLHTLRPEVPDEVHVAAVSSDTGLWPKAASPVRVLVSPQRLQVAVSTPAEVHVGADVST